MATIIPDGAAKGISLDLAISVGTGGVGVGESGTKVLPKFCPDRHINSDGTFCLGYPAPQVSTTDEAVVWWGLLKDYIELQRVASRTGRWPPKRWLSHGDAGGSFHIKALETAKRLGIEEDYYRNLQGEAVWFTDPWLRLDRTKTRLVNGRSPCPMGCRDRRGYPILRRNCLHKDDVVTLVRSEALRRKGEAAFWAKMRSEGVKCCGTMKTCPLKIDGKDQNV
ncbi:MAG: hypothetical protein JSR99_12270 [Proteobacteria bacterium]|nr:hypothetical protein [Pseudomonadota bacterium]